MNNLKKYLPVLVFVFTVAISGVSVFVSNEIASRKQVTPTISYAGGCKLDKGASCGDPVSKGGCGEPSWSQSGDMCYSCAEDPDPSGRCPPPPTVVCDAGYCGGCGNPNQCSSISDSGQCEKAYGCSWDSGTQKCSGTWCQTHCWDLGKSQCQGTSGCNWTDTTGQCKSACSLPGSQTCGPKYCNDACGAQLTCGNVPCETASPTPTPTESPTPTPTESPTPTPTGTPGPTATPTEAPTPTPTPNPSCNSACTSSSDCPSDLTCDTGGHCRNAGCTSEPDCVCHQPQATPAPTPAPTTPPAGYTLPTTGTFAAAAATVLGGLLLLGL